MCSYSLKNKTVQKKILRGKDEWWYGGNALFIKVV